MNDEVRGKNNRSEKLATPMTSSDEEYEYNRNDDIRI